MTIRDTQCRPSNLRIQCCTVTYLPLDTKVTTSVINSSLRTVPHNFRWDAVTEAQSQNSLCLHTKRNTWSFRKNSHTYHRDTQYHTTATRYVKLLTYINTVSHTVTKKRHITEAQSHTQLHNRHSPPQTRLFRLNRLKTQVLIPVPRDRRFTSNLPRRASAAGLNHSRLTPGCRRAPLRAAAGDRGALWEM